MIALMRVQLPCILITISLLAPSLHSQWTLSTQSRWIINVETKQRVKLACGNWAGHMDTMIPEGLDKKPIDELATMMATVFNCVRLTWATYMYTRSSTLNVEQSLASLNLMAVIDGFRKHNPNILGMTIVDAQAALIEALGNHGIMVILDNHISKPQWCCSNEDGNGFFGEEFFDPNEWLNGLELVATRYRGNRKVVGMSLRNEPRGPHQDFVVWKTNMQRGADIVHKANPDVLVIVSGIDYDHNLRFLWNNPDFRINMPDQKLVYEVHRYAFTTNSSSWVNDPLNKVCARFMEEFDYSAGYLTHWGRDSVPLLVSEFGVDQRRINEADNRFLPCMFSLLVDKDLDWALWAFHGSYYLRSGVVGMEEMYGLLDESWDYFRNLNFASLFQLPLAKVQDPMSKSVPYHLIYHPLNGNCLHIGPFNMIAVGICKGRTRWSYALDGRIRMQQNYSQCLKVVKEDAPITISNDCSSPESNWSILSESRLHIGARDAQGTQLCMEEGDNRKVYSKRCICVDGNDNCHDDPRNQWFKMVLSNV